MRVLKFGGACLASRDRLERVVDLVARTQSPRVVTVSALAGVTDRLHALVAGTPDAANVARAIHELAGRHHDLLPRGEERARARIVQELERLTWDVARAHETHPPGLAARDRVVSAGERLAVHLVAAWLRAAGVEAEAFSSEQAGILCDGRFGSAEVDLERTRREVERSLGGALGRGSVPVVTGYYGIGPAGEVATFGRSGTDYTATVLGHALGASRIELWKEVAGFLEADPRIIPEAGTIARLSYDEAVELAHFGARVIHPRALAPARALGTPIHILGVDDPEAPGTLISREVSDATGALTALTCRPRMAVLRVRGRSASRQQETMSAVAGSLGAAGIDILAITSAQTSLAVLVDGSDEPAALEALGALGENEVESARSTTDSGLVCAVGHGIAETRGMVARLLCAVVRARIEVELVCAGASTVACHLAVAEDEVERAARAIYQEFFHPAAGGRRLCLFSGKGVVPSGRYDAGDRGLGAYTIA